MAYYYLISSLPMLKADGDMPFSYDQFLDMCKANLNDDKYKLLEELTLSSNTGPFISKWASFYGIINEELCYQRKIKLGRKANPPAIRDESISKLVASAISNKNPLVAEEMLLALEFEKLDELVGWHYFDDYALIGYALKLKLLERKKTFDKQKGKSEFNGIIEKMEHQILNMEQE